MSALNDVRAATCRVLRDDSGDLAGTAFFILPSGYLLTCHHVIADLDELSVLVPGESKPRKAKFRKDLSDSASDIAVLQLPGPVPGAVQVGRTRAQAKVYGLGFRPTKLGNEPEGHTFAGQLDPGQRLRFETPATSRGGRRSWNNVPKRMRDGLVYEFHQANNLEQGISGGPVYDIDQRKVVGIFRAVEGEKSAYVIPMDAALARWPELASLNTRDVPDEDLDQLMRGFGIGLVADGVRPAGLARSDRYFADLMARHDMFAGRQAQIQRLDAFISQDAHAHFFVTGPTGLGKSALLANWAEALRERGLRRALHFITPRVDASQLFFLSNVCSELMAFHGLGGPLPSTERDLRLLYAQLLKLRSASRDQLTLIVDGLDEAHGRWTPEPGPEVFAAAPSCDVRIVLSARDTAGIDWPKQLGLQIGPDFIMRLDRLTSDGVRAVVLNSPLPALSGAHLDKVVTELQVHSGGDPFYLRDLIADVQAAGGEPSVIAKFPLEHSAYLQQWWTDGRAQVGADEFTDLMGTLAAAREGISRRVLLDISPDDHLRGANIAAVLSAASRYVSASASGRFSLDHERIRAFVTRTLADDMGVYHGRLAAYCLRWPESGLDSEARDYMLRNACDHLAAAGRRDEIFGALSPAWIHAKWAASGSYAGLIHDFDVAAATLSEKPTRVAPAAALCVASETARELMLEFPKPLLVAWLRLGDKRRVLASLNALKGTKGRAIEPLAAVAAEFLARGDGASAAGLLARALAMLPQVRATAWQIDNLAEISALLRDSGTMAPDDREHLYADARSFAESLVQPEARAVALGLVASIAPVSSDLAREAEKLLAKIIAPGDRLYARAMLLPALFGLDRQRALVFARAALSETQNPFVSSSFAPNPFRVLVDNLPKLQDQELAIFRDLAKLCMRTPRPRGFEAAGVVKAMIHSGRSREAIKLVDELFAFSAEEGAEALFECVSDLAKIDPARTDKWLERIYELSEPSFHDLKFNYERFVRLLARTFARLGGWQQAIELIGPLQGFVHRETRGELIREAANSIVDKGAMLATVERLTELPAETENTDRADAFAHAALAVLDRDREAAISYAARAASASLTELTEGDTDQLRELHALATFDEGDHIAAIAIARTMRWPEHSVKVLTRLIQATAAKADESLSDVARALVALLEGNPGGDLLTTALPVGSTLAERVPKEAEAFRQLLQRGAESGSPLLLVEEAGMRARLDPIAGSTYLAQVITSINSMPGEPADAVRTWLAAAAIVRGLQSVDGPAKQILVDALLRGLPTLDDTTDAVTVAGRRATLIAQRDCGEARRILADQIDGIASLAEISPAALHLSAVLGELTGRPVGAREVQANAVRTLAEAVIETAALCPDEATLLTRLADQAIQVDNQPDRIQALVSLFEACGKAAAEVRKPIGVIVGSLAHKVLPAIDATHRLRVVLAVLDALIALDCIAEGDALANELRDESTAEEMRHRIARARQRQELAPLTLAEQGLLEAREPLLAVAVLHKTKVQDDVPGAAMELLDVGRSDLAWERHRMLESWASLLVPVVIAEAGAAGVGNMIGAIEQLDQRFRDAAALVARDAPPPVVAVTGTT